MASPVESEVASAPRRVEGSQPFRIALLGNPNTGKTTLFNRLCGVRAKTANFPGTTTDARVGRCALDGAQGEITDLPGIYALGLDLPESNVCRAVLSGEGLYRKPEAVVVVIDATNPVRNLMLVGELLEYGLPTVVGLNMVDLAQRRGLTLDAERLSGLLGCPVVPMVARRGSGVEPLKSELLRAVQPRELEEALPSIVPRLDRSLFDGREAWAERLVEESLGGPDVIGSSTDTLTERLDQAFTHPVLGLLTFAGVMGLLFWTIFAIATVPMDLIEATFGHLGAWLSDLLPPGQIHDLLVDGVIGGIAGTVVFLPQICLLFAMISILEDTGYLARAAFVMDRLLCRFGLPGQAFVPLLSCHACAIPGIMAARLIPDRRDRLATILVAPLVSCSARLPVYVLLTSMLFRDNPFLAGLAFAGCYLLGGTAALLSSLVIRRSILPGDSRPMVLELPSYKWPSLRNSLLAAWEQGTLFLRTAGTIIMAICVVMWWLSAYPQGGVPSAAESLRVEAAAIEDAQPDRALELERDADYLVAKHQQSQSFAGRMGRAVAPAFAPLGFDWQLTVGVMTSFLAREVFVSTMAVLVVGDPELEVGDRGVVDRIRSATRDDGSRLFTTATSASLLVFFVLAMQCLPTLTVTRRETGSWRWAGLQLSYMTGLAWVCAFVTFNGLRLFGVT